MFEKRVDDSIPFASQSPCFHVSAWMPIKHDSFDGDQWASTYVCFELNKLEPAAVHLDNLLGLQSIVIIIYMWPCRDWGRVCPLRVIKTELALWENRLLSSKIIYIIMNRRHNKHSIVPTSLSEKYWHRGFTDLPGTIYISTRSLPLHGCPKFHASPTGAAFS